jgi:hypothetical protein
MQSLFNLDDNQAILNRIYLLQANNKAKWGKMNVSQMLAHCQVPPQIAFGEKKIKRSFLGILFGGMVKRSLMKPGPFKQNLPTAPDFVMNGEKNFEEEKIKLAKLVKRFAEQGPDAIVNEPHPFFGKLTKQEWDILNWKHLDHHLRQFGV